jgi:competence protein ComEC
MRDVRTALVTSILTLLALFVFATTSESRSSKEGLLEVTFLDVGQGDATFIESPSGIQILIDGGKNTVVLSALSEVLGFSDKSIDMVVATHPDADHIGGLVDVLQKYEVQNVLMTENLGDSPVYDAFMKAVADEGAEVYIARSGHVFNIGSGGSGTTTLRIFFPDVDPTHMESNTSSIVAQLSYGDVDYLLTGDSPIQIEEYLVGKEGSRLQSEVLKAGHHGSRTSSSETFVTTVSPKYAIISAGKNNSYGHPHKEVMEILNKKNVVTKNTADEGSIASFSNGKEVWFE